MYDKKKEERLDALKQRLYERGEGPKKREHFELTDEPQDVPKSWGPRVQGAATTAPEQNTADVNLPSIASPAFSEPMSYKSKRNSYRFKLMLIGLVFFGASIAVSSFFIMFGGNSISGENIAISISGPFTIGGGEVIPLQVGITNQNSVPIESATLVVEYPLGTQAADGSGKEVFSERLPLNNIESGETVNIPLRAQVFGEENQELSVRASVEYRVRGSNATFFKEATPLRFKVSSSPLVVSIEALRNVSSGQETEVKLTITSNSPTTLNDILVKAEYPTGFDFTRSEPAAVSGSNVWSITKLEPEESETITITGVILGTESEEHTMNFSVGVPNERDRFNLASIFAVASTEFLIEQAFLDVGITVNGVRNSTASISAGSQSNVSVGVKNTLPDAIYDGVVKLTLSGNALSDTQVQVNNGYYDSNTKTITWDISSVPALERIAPGDSENFSFSLTPSTNALLTPQINIDAAVRARRVSESRAEEELIGTVKAAIKVESGIELRSETGRAGADIGPVPPVVGNTTSYTVTWQSQNGSNDVSGITVTATLPSYVNWQGQASGEGTWDYNSTTRVVTWTLGEQKANKTSKGSFRVSILPSTSQIDKTPTIVSEQNLRGSDKFTGTVVRDSAGTLTTRLSEEAGYDKDSGVVQAN